MASGGARNRSGPQADPKSGRSDRRGLTFTSLPSEGYGGDFPPLSELLPNALEREGVVWAEAWTTPQAAQWAKEPWRHRAIAMWVRWSVKMEDPEASASIGTVVRQIADQIGLTPAGLKENGWTIAADEVGKARESKPEPGANKPAPKRRLRAVSGGGG